LTVEPSKGSVEPTKSPMGGVIGLTALIAGIGGLVQVITGFLENIKKAITASTGLPEWALWVAYGILILSGVWLTVRWRSRYSQLLQPDALRLDRDNPNHLVGRQDDLEELLQSAFNPITFVEGESGSGKSALIRAGLLPKLISNTAIVPLLID